MTAFGTETIGNSVRHNRVRETELFRQFLNLGHIYGIWGAYGYGTRLPTIRTISSPPLPRAPSCWRTPSTIITTAA